MAEVMPASAKRNLSPTTRDRNILAMVYIYGGVATHQIVRKFWPTAKSTFAYYQRLKLLVTNRYLKFQKVPTEGDDGTWYYFWTVRTEAEPILVTLLKLPLEHIRISGKPKS